MAAPSVVPSIVRSIVLLAILGLILYGFTRFVFWLFGGDDLPRTAATLTVEDGGTVNVAVEDGLLRRVDGSLKVYPDDRITTGTTANARLQFFDGSLARIDSDSDLTISKDAEDAEAAQWEVTTVKGALWVRIPTLDTYSGSITRVIDFPRYDAVLTSDTEAVFEEDRLMVFSADGQGISITIDGLDEPVVIGEGQQFELPDGQMGSDPYRYRSAIEPLAAQRSFITESRTLVPAEIPGVIAGSGSINQSEPLTVSEPVNGTTVTTSTVRVTGQVSALVDRVRINSYEATIDRTSGTFTQELALQSGNQTTLLIEALDSRGLTVGQESRTVYRGSETVTPPSITAPAAGGQIYRTNDDEIAVSGTAPRGTAGIIVNDYRLQLYRAGDTTWSYLASKALGNLRDGQNIFDVTAVDAAGNRSAPVRMTVMVEAGAEGVIGGNPSSTSSVVTVEETDLPQNDPLMPGTISITGPQPGSVYTATGSEFLLEGTTPRETASVWVNGYKLQLYRPGVTFWNYIAKTEYNTLKPGTNVYRIVARNAENRILDTFEYTVTYNP